MDQSNHSEIKTTIFINPKFKAHINPNFFNNIKPPTTTNNIFVNPKFISNLNSNGNQYEMEKVAQPQAKIIKQTNRNLIRQPILNSPKAEQSPTPTNQLIKIGRRKLVRPAITQPNHDVRVSTGDNSAKGINLRSTYKIVNKESLNIYKIDRRRMKPTRDRIMKRLKFFNQVITPTKIIVTDYKLCRIGNSRYSSKPIEDNMLNINGVLYKSSKTKLQKQSPASIDNTKSRQLNRQSSNSSACSLYVRGEKFHLDASGKKLVRVSNSHSNNTKNRIYLGGLTYIAKSNNTYESTNSHNTRLHLSTAKQKSIDLLSRNLVKSNVPCLIYRKLGKCLALQRGRCAKIHDRNQIAICQKFLKGSCNGENCLLSHDTSLSKMPTCKFFLLGQCAKSDCQYLHKKVNIKTAICHDFLRGYCAKAEKCNLRHEFLCPNFESKDGCTITRCPYVHKNKSAKPEIERPATTTVNSRKTVAEPGTSSSTTSTSLENKRYFFNDNQSTVDDQQSNDESNVKLNRALAKVARMKSYYDSVGQDLETTISDNTHELCVDNDKPKIVFPRKKLGKLPSFIPID